jgi:hypothetical protein
VVKLVVGAQSRKRPAADTVGKENLRGSVHPGPGGEQFLPARSDEVEKSFAGPAQGHRTAQQDQQDDVWEQSREPNYLESTPL